jgi:4-amino-4-deoxy-L-arabinose transferase-like glycosyltransferase
MPQAAGAGGMMGATTALTAPEQAIYDYVTAHREGASYLMAIDSWAVASPYILATGREVLPMGGFSGSVPEPTLARVKQLVSTGQLRFFLLGAGGGGAIGGHGAGSSDAIAAWVHSTCTSVPARDYLGTPTATRSTSGFGAASGSQILYSCKS